MFSRFYGFMIELLKTIAIVFVLAFIIRYFLIQPFIIEGSSMEPTYHDKQLILIDKISYRISAPKRGDVVVFESPQNHAIYYIKRIIGLPGDEVTIKNGSVFVNGKQIEENYLARGQKTTVEGMSSAELDQKVGKDQYFVMGDNRDRSSDSREWGLLDKELIAGKLLVVIYPRDSYSFNSETRKFGLLKHQPTFQF